MYKIDSYDFKGKRAIIRVDFNVPLDAEGRVTDDTRIRAAIPTIEKVLEGGGSVILMSHLGRPKKNNDTKFSLEQIIPAIEARLGRKVLFAGDAMGDKAAEMARELKPGEVMLLENLRFHAEEEGKPRGVADDATDEQKAEAKSAVKASQKEFVKRLASYADCYINDAFGTAHRAHASTALIADYFPHDKMFGYVMENELRAIDSILENPRRPFCAVLGGSKVSTKISIIEKLMEKVDSIVLGGGMTYTFEAALGGRIGNSICEPEMFPVALEILRKAKQKGVRIVTSPDALTHSRPTPAPRRPRPTISPTAGKAWISAKRASGFSASTSSAAKRSSGTGRSESSRSTSSPPVPAQWPKPSPRRPTRAPTRSSAAATQWPASISSAWPTG